MLRLAVLILAAFSCLASAEPARRLQQNSAAVAATGNAQATATTNGQTITATGGPGCSSTATLGSNSYAFASGPPCSTSAGCIANNITVSTPASLTEAVTVRPNSRE